MSQSSESVLLPLHICKSDSITEKEISMLVTFNWHNKNRRKPFEKSTGLMCWSFECNLEASIKLKYEYKLQLGAFNYTVTVWQNSSRLLCLLNRVSFLPLFWNSMASEDICNCWKSRTSQPSPLPNHATSTSKQLSSTEICMQ